MWLVLHIRLELIILSESNFEFDAFAVSPMEHICWRIPNPTSNSVTGRSPFPINPTIFNVDALMSFSFFTLDFTFACLSHEKC